MGCARLGVLWAGGGRWMGGQSKINFAWKRGLSSVYMLLWTDEGGGRSTTNLGHELCGLIHDDVRRRVISVTLPCWCACTSSVDRVRIRNRRELKGSVEGARVSGRTPFESAPPRDSMAPPRSHTTQHHPPTRTPYIRPQGSTTTAAVQPQVPQQPRRLAFACGTIRRDPNRTGGYTTFSAAHTTPKVTAVRGRHSRPWHGDSRGLVLF